MRRLAERLAGPDHRDYVLQEALTAAWRHRSRFDPGRGTAQAWLLAITANHAKKALRSAWRHAPLEDDGPPHHRDAQGIRIDLERAVQALPHRQRLAVELCYFLGLPLGDAAEVMGCAEGTVKATLTAARAGLRSALGEDYR
jgi:RNA polymerase sigma-70 factor (ECF subfamily)